MSTLSIKPLPTPPSGTVVFFDGGCPLCTKEIAHYRSQVGANAVTWVDVSREDPAAYAPGLSRAEALAYMHALEAGELQRGAKAFRAIWRALPRYRLLAKVSEPAAVVWLLDLGYRAFLKVRPLWRKSDACMADSCRDDR